MLREDYEAYAGKIGRLEWIRMNLRGHILYIANHWPMPDWLRAYLYKDLPFGLSIIVKPTEEDMQMFKQWLEDHPDIVDRAYKSLGKRKPDNLNADGE